MFLAIRSCWEGELRFCLSGKTEGVQWLIGEAGTYAEAQKSAAFHSLYCQISDRLGGGAPIPTLDQLCTLRPKGAEEIEAGWRALSFLKRESNRCLCRRNSTKTLLLRCFAWRTEGHGPFPGEEEEELAQVLSFLRKSTQTTVLYIVQNDSSIDWVVGRD